MTKLELLYQELLKREVVTYKEIEDIFKEIGEKPSVSFRYLYTEYIHKLLQKGKLLHPQKGLYVAVPPTKINVNSYQPDKYLIASKIQSLYYLGFHTALELYGCAYSVYNEIYIVVPSEQKFRNFTFKQIHYRPVFTAYATKGVKKRLHKNHELIMSTPSRTFLDCINRPEYVGGWEECLKSLEGLSGVNAQEIQQLLTTIRKDMLFRKTGFILTLLSDNPYYTGLIDTLQPFLQRHIGTSPMYLKKGIKSTLNTSWKLYVPIGFEYYLKGV